MVYILTEEKEKTSYFWMNGDKPIRENNFLAYYKNIVEFFFWKFCKVMYLKFSPNFKNLMLWTRFLNET